MSEYGFGPDRTSAAQPIDRLALLGAESPSHALADLARRLGTGVAELVLESTAPGTGAIAVWRADKVGVGRRRRSTITVPGEPPWHLHLVAHEGLPVDRVERADPKDVSGLGPQVRFRRLEARLEDLVSIQDFDGARDLCDAYDREFPASPRRDEVALLRETSACAARLASRARAARMMRATMASATLMLWFNQCSSAGRTDASTADTSSGLFSLSFVCP